METELYDVTLIGFPQGTPNGEPPIEAMQRLFHIDRNTASRFLRAMPVTVKHSASPPIAQQYRDGLQAIGARVALKPTTPVPRAAVPPPPQHAAIRSAKPEPSRRPSPLSERSFSEIPMLDGVGVMPTPTPTPVRRPSSSSTQRPSPSSQGGVAGIPMLDGVGVTPTPTPIPARRSSAPPPIPMSILEDDDEPGFFSSIVGCFVTPLKGSGISWLLAAFGVAIVAVIGGMVPFVGWLVQLLMGLGMLTLCARFFQSCMVATSANDDKPGGLPDLSFFVAEYILPGIALAAWFVSAHVPLLWWLRTSWESTELMTLLLHPVTIALVVAPYLLWPMALAVATSSGSFLSMWHLPKIIMGIVRAPLQYVVVLFVGVLLSVVPAAMVPVLGASSGSILALLLIGVGQVVIMAYSHAVMGSLMGHLARVKPEAIGD